LNLNKSAKKKKESKKARSQNAKVAREAWPALAEAFKNGDTLRAILFLTTKGGFHAKVLGVVAFLPSDQLTGFSAKLFAQIKGQEIDVKVTKLVLEDRKVFVSHDLVLDPKKKTPKFKSLPSAINASQIGGTAKPEIRPKIELAPDTRQCQVCHHKFSRSYSVCPDCRYKRLTRQRSPPRPTMVQGGSPGLRKKRTLQLAKRKRKK
jgi:DNA-directed RNA polymerase subunit RPC12/RpoP